MSKNTSSPNSQFNDLCPRKPSIYAGCFTPEEQALLDKGFPPPTFDRDANLLRLKLKAILKNGLKDAPVAQYASKTFSDMVDLQLEKDFDENGPSGVAYRNFVAWLQSPSLTLPEK